MDPTTFIIIAIFAWLTLSTISKTPWFNFTNPEIGWGWMFYRTTKLNNLIDRIARFKPIFWKFFWDIGVISGLGILLAGLVIFTVNIPLFFVTSNVGSNQGTPAAIAVAPVIPGITVSLQSLPYFLIAVMVGAIVHEFAHGIAARVEKIDLKSTGIFVFLVFFGAFVEPDEECLSKKSRRSKIRVMAAGALANMMTALLFLFIFIPLLFPVFLSPFYQSSPSGALIIETIPENPAYQAGIKSGYAIIAINSSSGYIRILSVSDFQQFTKTSVLPNQELTFIFDNNLDSITLKTTEHPTNSSRGFIGIRTVDYFKSRISFLPYIFNLFPYWISTTFLYIFMINLMFAVMNLLPVPFLDGDKLLTEFLGPKFHKYQTWIKFYALGILVLNMLLSLLITGWQQI
ncbi:MAG: site-2 protease family protein [Candidatus Hodarchaeales archaeon]